MGFGWSRGTAESGLLGTEVLWRGTAGILGSPAAVEEVCGTLVLGVWDVSCLSSALAGTAVAAWEWQE